MNKSGFIEELQNRTAYTEEQCAAINGVLENHFIFRKKNKPAIVADLAQRLSIDGSAAESVYEISMEIIRAEKRKALRRPFGSRK